MVIASTTGTVASSSGLKLESLTEIDMATLSQSDLQKLSLCSDAAFDLRRTDDVVFPRIDPKIFNESEGSRRQTYSRPRYAPLSRDSAAAGHRSRLPNPRPPPALPRDDPERAEDKHIVNALKHLIAGGTVEKENTLTNQLLPPRPPLPPQPVVSGQTDACTPQGMQIVVYTGERKRKRGRKPRPEVPENAVEIPLQKLNKNGVQIDFKVLEKSDDIFGAELRRRTAGLETEEAALGFLGNLGGEWGSRRRKRRFVDAGEFGDALPVGWKLSLALKRRDGRVSIYCRRYVSPNGQQFASCKEASSYLQSYFGLLDASQSFNQTGANNQQVHIVASECVQMNVDVKEDPMPSSTQPSPTVPTIQETESTLVGIENLPEVEVRDLFECYKCNIAFDEKVTYMKHLMKFHQRTTKRYTLGSSMGEGMTLKEGSYECQICHNVFLELQSYTNHLKIHVRKDVGTDGISGQGKSSESPSQDELPQRISKMDALIEIAQNSFLETSTMDIDVKTHVDSSLNKLKVMNIPETLASNDTKELEMKDNVTKNSPHQVFNQYDCNYTKADKERVNSDHISLAENNLTVICTSTTEELDEVEKHVNNVQEIDLGNDHVTSSRDKVSESLVQTLKEKVLQNGFSDSLRPVIQSLQSSFSVSSMSNKGNNEFHSANQKLDSIASFDNQSSVSQKFEYVTGFDDLRWDEIEPLTLGFGNGQELPSLPEISFNVANNEGMAEGYNCSARFRTEPVALDFGSTPQLTNPCIWCRTVLNYAAIETRSDSVGLMCPVCKSSLDNGSSINSGL